MKFKVFVTETAKYFMEVEAENAEAAEEIAEQRLIDNLTLPDDGGISLCEVSERFAEAEELKP